MSQLKLDITNRRELSLAALIFSGYNVRKGKTHIWHEINAVLIDPTVREYSFVFGANIPLFAWPFAGVSPAGQVPHAQAVCASKMPAPRAIPCPPAGAILRGYLWVGYASRCRNRVPHGCCARNAEKRPEKSWDACHAEHRPEEAGGDPGRVARAQAATNGRHAAPDAAGNLLAAQA